MRDSLEVRQLTPEELPAAIDVGNRAFGSGEGDGFHFGRDIPYVWNADRADNSWACFEGDEMLGLVGAYPFDVKMGGVSFRATCVGQVATPAEHRGRGVMSALLRAATAKMDDDVDFAWLSGDRMRYGRYGWAVGGVQHVFRTNVKNLPDPPAESTVRLMDPARDGKMIQAFAEAQPFGIGFSDQEFNQLLSIRGVGGVVSDDAWAVFRGEADSPFVMMADGTVEAVAGLLAHLAAGATGDDNAEGSIGFETAPCDCVLSRVALKYYREMTPKTCAHFRMCNLVGYFEKACRIVEPTLAGGSDEITFRNTDNGQRAHIVCRDGKLAVDGGEGGRLVEADTHDLSEIAFSRLTLETVLPGLAANSPLRALLRMPIYLPFSFYAM